MSQSRKLNERSNKKFIVPYLLQGSSCDELELEVIKSVLFDKNTLSCGEQRDKFDEEFADFLDTKYALSLTSCTIALEFATYLLGLKPSDQVIATPLTYQASVQPLLTSSAEVRFCDIEPNSLGLDPQAIRSLITDRTKAIYLTHYGGMMADMESIMQIAREYNILVVEDCAHAIGSQFNQVKAGTIGDIGCFSFQSSKNISSLGEGGMIVFSNRDWAHIIKRIRANEPHASFVRQDQTFGPYRYRPSFIELHSKNAFTHECINIMHSGTNSTLSEPAAAVGRWQLRKINILNHSRKEKALYLNQALSEIDELRIQIVPDNIEHTYHLYTCFVRPEYKISRDDVIDHLYNSGIEIVLRYFPLHLLPEWRYRGGKFGQCPTAERIWFEELINLPLYPTLTYGQLDYMIEKIKEAILKCSAVSKTYYS